MRPLFGALALNVNLQASAPAPIIEEYVQLRPVREAEDEPEPFPCNFTALATPTVVVLLIAVRLSWPSESVVEEGA